MAEQGDGVRAGEFPFDKNVVVTSRESLAPPSIAEVRDIYGAVTVGTSHPSAEAVLSHTCTRPPIDLNDPATPSDEEPPSVEEALAAKAAQDLTKPKAYKAQSRYQVRFNKRIEIEPDFWLSPHETHTIGGDLATKFKADIDAAVEVS